VPIALDSSNAKMVVKISDPAQKISQTYVLKKMCPIDMASKLNFKVCISFEELNCSTRI
jgi:hypothetical protein